MPPRPLSSPEEPLSGLSDEELACRTQAGSSACFAELVTRHENRLLRFLLQRTRHLHDAEDLLQDTFARAYQRIDSYDSTWRFSTWLYTIAARLACSHFRKARPALLADPDRQVAGGHNPAAIAARNEEKQNLWALAGEALSLNQYSALWLRYAEGMSVKEISKVMRKTQTHVKVLLFRGRTGLGRRLRGAEGPAHRAPSARSVAAPCAATAAEGGA